MATITREIISEDYYKTLAGLKNRDKVVAQLHSDEGVQKKTPSGMISVHMRGYFDSDGERIGTITRLYANKALHISITPPTARPNKHHYLLIRSDGSCHVGGNKNYRQSERARNALSMRIIDCGLRSCFSTRKSNLKRLIDYGLRFFGLTKKRAFVFTYKEIKNPEVAEEFFRGVKFVKLFADILFASSEDTLRESNSQFHLEDEAFQENKIERLRALNMF
ncbi:MAG: hypothetical protein K1060chlam2_01240 [Chlamydiae bacterium]|nr:hypothetical protein [Chlamydiota bacterium]